MTAETAVSQISSKVAEQSQKSETGIVVVNPQDAAQFDAALNRHMSAGIAPTPAAHGSNKISLGDKILGRVNELASGVKKDQEYISKILEQATRTGDSMQMMKAMLALNDFSMRSQAISKTVSKATSSIDQLTKLQ